MFRYQLIILPLFISLLFTSCKQSTSVASKPAQEISFDNYSSDWTEVEQLEKKGMGKSILQKVDFILEKAVEENNINQIFKALAYRSKYSNNIEEESSLKIITQYEERVLAAEFPLKQLLHSATAELYFQYYSQNRWRFNQRTTVEDFNPDDIRGWDLEKIVNTIQFHYQASLVPKEDLSQFPTQQLRPIISFQFPDDYLIPDDTLRTYNYALDFRPTLYDFLADRALNYFKQNEGRVSKPINEFNIDEHGPFSSSITFSGITFSTTDSSSNSFYAAKIYQELILLHQNDKNPNVLINFELDRLQHYHITSNNELKDSLYLTALTHLSKQYVSFPSADEIDFHTARLYFQLGSAYDRKDTSDEKRWLLKKAHAICKSKMQRSTFGAKQCAALLQNIKMESFNFYAEDTYLPNQNLLYRFQYQNIDSIYFRIVKVPHQIEEQREFNNLEKLISRLVKMTPVKSWKEILPNPGDFQQHSLELFTGGLSKGNYYLLASPNKNFDINQSQIAQANFKISQLAYFSRQTKDGKSVEVYVRNRDDGKGVNDADIDAYTFKYDYSTRSNSYYKVGSFKTDQNGYSSFVGDVSNKSLFFSIITPEDTLSANSSYYLYSRNYPVKSSIRTHFFTDRAVYRPGQVVYFKGICIESNGKTKKPKSDYKSTVKLYNVNGETLNSIELTTNLYGSYSGSFVLPNSGLNGQYRIQNQHGSQYFSVEDYKRPSFKIEIENSTNQNRINYPITIKGKAETYAGAKVSNAQLSYRVVRKASYPFWSPFRSFYPPANQKEIANGSIFTDESGAFSFAFLAQADPTIQTKWNPLYNYEILLDLTNINGETQSLSKTIRIGQQALYLSSPIDDAIQLKDLKNIVISAKNVNGENLTTSAQLSLWKLKTPSSPKKQKLWAQVDQGIITEDNFKTTFPSYPTNSEHSIEAFLKDYEVSNSLINCNQTINTFRDIKPGAYEIIASTKDQYGAVVVWKKRFVLFNENEKSPPYPLFSWLEELQTKSEVGDTAHFLFSSSLKNLQVLYEVELDNEITHKEWLLIDNEQKRISIPIKEKHIGGISVHFTAVHSDRIIQYNRNVVVPYSNKKLKLELGTYRDKVAPNSEEKWTLTISSDKGDAMVAELLAGMYDQSLDQFKKRDWNLNLYHINRSQLKWDLNQSFNAISSRSYSKQRKEHAIAPKRYHPQLNWFGFYLNPRRYGYYNKSMPMAAQSMGESVDFAMEETETVLSKNSAQSGAPNKEKTGVEEKSPPSTNPIRKDFRETVFFYPKLITNEKGKTTFEFKMPEALTQWKFRALAHTKDLKIGTIETSIQTQKELMVIPNSPRFFREGDELSFKVLVNNLSTKRLSGFAKLRFFDAETGNPIDIFSDKSADLPFDLFKDKNTVLSWNIKIPNNIDAITYQVIAKTDDYSDGEEKAIPVLPNRMLVTESLPLWIRGNESKQFSFEKLLNSKKLESLTNESFTLEFSPNPAWYAIQALPNLTEQGNECSEHVFARLYANSLASLIANQHPRIKSVFEQWKGSNSDELVSKLMQNQELKNILIEDTPWLQKAKNDTEQKQRIALLFDYNRMAQEKKNALNKLIELQLPNGGWSWYKGMRDNRYITQYIVEGLGHLMKLGVDLKSDKKLLQMLQKATLYLDNRLLEDYDRLIARKVDLKKNNLGHLQLHYLYTRSFFQETPKPKRTDAFNYYLKQAQEYWLDRSLHNKAMIALSVSRLKSNSALPQQILASLTDNAIADGEMGMYWKENTNGYYWYQSAIETQALLIELYRELNASDKIVDELKIWLLKQKQTQTWSNSKATALACYALLMGNVDLLNLAPNIEITVGSEAINIETSNSEAGIGYYKKHWSQDNVKPELGNISISKQSKGIAWGAAYWQYYQDIDKITSANESGLKISKALFKSIVTDKGEIMKPIDVSEIFIGDKIKVRLKLVSDRDLEFVHLKDHRAAAFEPLNVLSHFKYQDGLGYYESTKDASTNFFIDWLPKGTYIFEYDLRASLEGGFSSGISSIQCQYAPEFSAHSAGRRIKIIDQ